eukprot:359185-Chlamydomonas_euryale.AAC.10
MHHTLRPWASRQPILPEETGLRFPRADERLHRPRATPSFTRQCMLPPHPAHAPNSFPPPPLNYPFLRRPLCHLSTAHSFLVPC